MRGDEPAPRLPLRDAVAHAKPVREITSPVLVPPAPMVSLDDEAKELALGLGDRGVDRVHPLDERFPTSTLSHDVSSVVGKVHVV